MQILLLLLNILLDSYSSNYHTVELPNNQCTVYILLVIHSFAILVTNYVWL